MMDLGGHCLWQSCSASAPVGDAAGTSAKSSWVMPALPEEAQFRVSDSSAHEPAPAHLSPCRRTGLAHRSGQKPMRRLAIFMFLLIRAQAACNGGSTPLPGPTPSLVPTPTETPVPTYTPTPVATPTETPAATPAPTAMPDATPTPNDPAPTPSDAGLHMSIGPDTVWGDLVGKLTAPEQSCIQDSVEPPEKLPQTLDKPVLGWVDADSYVGPTPRSRVHLSVHRATSSPQGQTGSSVLTASIVRANLRLYQNSNPVLGENFSC